MVIGWVEEEMVEDDEEEGDLSARPIRDLVSGCES